MEPGEIAEAQVSWDAGLDKADERRIWIENRAKQLFEDGIDYHGMAYEVDATKILGRALVIWYAGLSDDGVFRASNTMREMLDTEVLKYCFEVAEEMAKDNGF